MRTVGLQTNRTRAARTSLFGVAVVAGLMVFVLPSGLVGAMPVPATASAGTAWAYGNVTSINFSGTSANGVPYTGSATYGYTVLINQTNLSANEFELLATRTTGVLFAVEYCYPTCRAPTYYVRLAAHLWQTVTSGAFVLTNGTVQESGGPVTAYALTNATTVTAANETESWSSLLPVSGGGTASRSGYLGVAVGATTTVDFGTPLGLFPTNLSTSQNWTSSAAFVATARASYTFFAEHTGPLGTVSASAHGAIPVQANGTVAVAGAYTTSDSIQLGGLHLPEVSLTVNGPFRLEEGVILVPIAVDLFGGATQPWSANETGSATATMSYVDFRAGAGGHFGLDASRWYYDSDTLESSADLTPASSGVTQLAGTGTPDSAPSTVVQGEPESPATAGATQSCLITGSGCPTGGSSSPTRGLLGAIAVGVVAVAALAVAVVVVERRRMPPPAYPNASLYPPGASARSGAPAPPEPAPPAPEDDPLGNLW